MSKAKVPSYHSHLAQIVETMHGAIAIIDPAERIMMVNKALERMTGYSRTELIGRRCTSIN